jgi:hypothetical protein
MQLTQILSYSILGFIWRICCGCEEVGVLGGRDGVDEPAGGRLESFDRALCRFAQQDLEFGEDHLRGPQSTNRVGYPLIGLKSGG